MLFFAGLIGGMKRLSAMETVKLSFGGKGCPVCRVKCPQLCGLDRNHDL